MNQFIEKLFLLKRIYKIFIQLFVDTIIILIIFILAMYLRLDNYDFVYKKDFWVTLIITIPSTLIIFYRLGFYKNIIRYVSSQLIMTVFYGVSFSSLLILFFSQLLNLEIPRSVPVIYFALMIIFFSGTRFTVSLLYKIWKRPKPKIIAIYGAGSAGRQLLNYLKESNEYKTMMFFDDNQLLKNKNLMGIPVFSFENASKLIAKHKLSTILLAMPGLNKSERQKIINKVHKFNLEIKSIPNISDIINGHTKINDLSMVTIEEILDREPVIAKQELLKPNIENKIVLVTGAGGSIGSELCRQIIKIKPKHLILLDNSEFNLYNINEELKNLKYEKKINIKVSAFLVSIQNENRLLNIFRKYKIQTIYHAAAYKHVPLLEENIIEGIKNNVIGTKILVNISIKLKVENFILISTDKAVRPTNYMGATKRIAEMICQASAKLDHKTNFCVVRFGNVMGSSGSVIPLFKKQIENNGPITVTGRSITRYFMTITEAAQLVIQAGSISNGGEIFILDMGKPIKILELAKRMSYLHGLKPYIGDSKNGDIEIKIIGLRPGEKIKEELSRNGKHKTTIHPRIMKVFEKLKKIEEIENDILNINKACNNEDLEMINIFFNKLDSSFNLSKNFDDKKVS